MNKKIGVLTALVLGVALTASQVAGTYAKYTSEKNASDTARVAKWSFKVGSGEDAKDIATTDMVFDLFNTINEADTTTAETDVAAANGTDTVIAPGTGGSFDIVLTNASEVNAKYTIALEETANASNIPVEYSIDGTTWKADFIDINNDTDKMKEVAINKNGGTTTVKVYWRWAFIGAESTNYTSSQTDATDTDLGIGGTATITVKATITATQVD